MYILGGLAYGLLLIYANARRQADEIQDYLKTYMAYMPDTVVSIQNALYNYGISLKEANAAINRFVIEIHENEQKRNRSR
jgi:hypothetical protein